MTNGDSAAQRFTDWLSALDARHLAHLSFSEVARALRALSSCYVERRARLAEGGALSGAGKRAAFALFYAPVHFLVAQHVVRALPAQQVRQIHDIGCGTGAAGAAWGLEAGRSRVAGIDRHPWAVAEANWTYARLGLDGHARQQDVSRWRLPSPRQAGIVAAYTVNELPDAVRAEMLGRLVDAHAGGASVLIIEPIARWASPWWNSWAETFGAAGGRADEWRFPSALPPRQRELARAAGLNPRELTARSLFMAPGTPRDAGISRIPIGPPRRPIHRRGRGA